MHVSYTNFSVTTHKENKIYPGRLQKTQCGTVNGKVKEGIIVIFQEYVKSC